jgi:cellulose synthase operon protein B
MAALFAVIALLLGSQAAFADRLSPTPDISLKGLGTGDLIAKGHLPGLDIWFTGYGDYKPAEGSYLNLDFDHSELVRPEDSTLTVTVNDTPVSSFLLTSANAKRTNMKIAIPADRLLRDVNHVRIKYYMRLRYDDCLDDNDEGLWSTVYQTSYLHYEYESPLKFLGLPPLDLGKLPDPVIRNVVPQTEIAVVVPDKPSASLISSAASVAARFGQWSSGRPMKATLHTAGQFSQEIRVGRDVVVIGEPGSNPILDELLPTLPIKFKRDASGAVFVDGDGNAIDPTSGILQLVVSPWDPRTTVLVLTGGNDEGVQRAVRTVSSRLAMKALQGPFAIVNAATEELKKGEAASQDRNSISISLDQLDLSDSTVKGYGARSITFAMDVPPVDSQAGAYMDLVTSYSPLVDPVLSSVTVSLNGTPVRSLALKTEASQRSTQRIQIPAANLKPGLNSVTVTFNLYAKRSDWYCMPLADERAWAVLHADSAFVLPLGPDAVALDLAYYPYPFVRQGSTANTFLVLPDQPDMLSASLQVAVALGKQSVGNSTEIQAALESQLTDDIKRKYHLIVFNAPTGSGLMSELTSKLPMTLEPGSQRSLQKAEAVLLGIKDAANLGIIELIQSPWNTDRALLLVSGTNPEMARQSPIALEGRFNPGNVALVTKDDQGRTQTVGIKLSGTGDRIATGPKSQSRLFLLAAAPAALVVLGMMGLMLARTAGRSE